MTDSHLHLLLAQQKFGAKDCVINHSTNQC